MDFEFKKIDGCFLCEEGHDFWGHLVILAMVQLMVENFPKEEFREEEVYEKCDELSYVVTPADIHYHLNEAVIKYKKLLAREMIMKIKK